MIARKTILFFLVFIFTIPSFLFAIAVSESIAEQVAINLYKERNDLVSDDFRIIESFVEKEDSENLFYIFNFDKKGFVIVAAEDAAVPILGYSFNHNYSSDNLPPQFRVLLSRYKEQILYIKKNDYIPSQEIINSWNRLKVSSELFVPENYRAVGPLLSTTWNQGQYYNESCPADAGSVPGNTSTPQNGYVWAGCTATATAQVMKYHAHPATGEGSHSYTHTTYGVQSANFATTSYNWALMPNSVTSVTPSVHTLLYHVGVGAEMNYGLYGSGAYIGSTVYASALGALQDYFKYDPNSYHDQRDNYSATPSVWHSMLKTELDNNRPLVYDGYNSGGGDGHAFVIDGYQGASNDSYHVNFGWSGSYNGYYTLDAIAPVPPTHDYRFHQSALFGVQPRKWRALPDVSIDVSLLPYTGVDLDSYYEGPTPVTYTIQTNLSGQEFALTINGNNELVFTQNPAVTSNVSLDITIRATYTGGQADDTFNFAITGVVSNIDWGDAPDPSYPTLQASSGANHTIVSGLQLGTLIDAESDGQPNATATGDDNDGTNDDDGITFTSALIPGGATNYTANVPVMCILNAWIDFDGNGSWADAGEQVETNTVLNAGTNNLNFLVPVTATIGTTFARFRVNSQGNLSYTGSASDGEVEDYQVTIGEESSLKWEQLPDLSPTGMDVDATNQPDNPEPILLADDFLCTETGNITDIHIWGSWLNDRLPYWEMPEQVEFTFSIHADIPASQSSTGYSMPGETLWINTWQPTLDDVEEAYFGLEDWYNPFDQSWLDDNHNLCYKYNYILDPNDYFLQEGTIDNPIVYWFNVQAIPSDPDPGCRFGWKTSLDHWNDDAVWINQIDPYNGIWYDLIYPPGHEMAGESIDLAFQITTEETPEELDYGDAPDPNYPTLSANNGACHIIDSNIYMGASIDSETDGQPDANATGDDIDGNDDEDGVTFKSILVQGYSAHVTVNTSVDGYLNAWLDYNCDGDWADTGEQIFTDENVSAGDNDLTFTVPVNATANTSFARFRFDTTGGLTYTGQADDGEVEDYLVVIHEPIDDVKMHFPQWPDPAGWDVICTADSFLIADDWQCTESGPVTDIHFWTSWLGGDGWSGLIQNIHISIHDDIPGPPYSKPGNLLWEKDFQPGEYTYESYWEYGLQGWFDPFNQNAYPEDHDYFDFINITDIPDPFYQTEGNIYWLDIMITIDPAQYPAGYRIGWKTSDYHFMDNAVYYDGEWKEMEDPITLEPIDMAFAITGSGYTEQLDYGDAPDPSYPTLLANDGARHTVDGVTFLGTQIDTETDGLQSLDALGDDNDNLSDEDGVTFNSIIIGSPAQVEVTTSVAGYLQGWVDFNADGDWTDTGEQIFTDAYIHFPGTVCLNYIVPTNATTGNTFARFRFSTINGVGITGLAANGEVEDYQVEIEENPELKWSQLPCEQLPGLHCHDYEIPPDPYNVITIADDWQCNGGLVREIHWWGNYEAVNSGINYFHLSIHNNDAANCLPLEPEVYGIDVPLSQVNETNTGLFNDEGNIIYKYECVLSDPFQQTEGSYYWLDISAYSNDALYYAKWRWQESSRSTNSILCNAADKSLAAPWNHIIWTSIDPWRYSDMAFEIFSCSPSEPLNLTVTKSGTNIVLQWNTDPCASYYNVYSSTDPNATFPGGWTLESTGTNITNNTWSEPASSAGSKKFYRVTSGNQLLYVMKQLILINLKRP